MVKTVTRILFLLGAMVMLIAAPSVSAWGGDDGRDDDGGRGEPDQAVSYINPDTGAATQNNNIDPNSSCFNPDRYDEQQRLSDPGTTNRNVHNDACFLGGRSWSGDDRVDAPATFESFGVGFISACPDPDGPGPKVAIARDTDGDGQIDFCFQSGYQETGKAGDLEFHARMNNTTESGDQTVVWCYDPDKNGCADETIKDVINVLWVSVR